jgi:hypothetical protein
LNTLKIKPFFPLLLAIVVATSGCSTKESAASSPSNTEAQIGTTGGTTTTSTPAPEHPDWTEIKADGFTVSFPPNWAAVKLDKTTYDQDMAALIQKNPKLKAMEISAKALSDGGNYKMYAVDTNALGKPFLVNLNVNAVEVGSVPIEQLAEASQKQLQTMAVSGTKSELSYEDMPVGKVALIKTNLKAPNDSKVDSRAYLVLLGTTGYIFTFSSDEGNADTASQAHDIMATLKKS